MSGIRGPLPPRRPLPPGGLGMPAGGIGGPGLPGAGMPVMKKGGKVKRTGPHKLHKGEKVLTAKQAKAHKGEAKKRRR
jgi:hypothetical protein